MHSIIFFISQISRKGWGHPRRSLAIFHHWRHTIFSSRSVDKTQLSKPSSLHCFNKWLFCTC
uniref:Uncharacterized protein n=1 Tax=Globodera pallida TaxID=36090 RepID=A0A183CTJ2_GLOPA